MVYKKEFNLNHVDITEDNINQLIKIIQTKIKNDLYYSKYLVVFDDGSEIFSEKADVFSEYEVKNKTIKKIYIKVCDNNANDILVDLHSSSSYNDITIESSNKSWYDSTCNMISDFIKMLKKQYIFGFIPYSPKANYLILIAFNSIASFLILSILFKIIPNKYDSYVIILFLPIIFSGSFIFLDIISKAYPVVAFDFGAEHTKPFKKNRETLTWIISSLIVPILLNIIFLFV